jgi:hypothetical protein
MVLPVSLQMTANQTLLDENLKLSELLNLSFGQAIFVPSVFHFHEKPKCTFERPEYTFRNGNGRRSDTCGTPDEQRTASSPRIKDRKRKRNKRSPATVPYPEKCGGRESQ